MHDFLVAGSKFCAAFSDARSIAKVLNATGRNKVKKLLLGIRIVPNAKMDPIERRRFVC